MGIISSEILSVSPQIDGTRDIREKHMDSLGRAHFVNYNACLDIDIEAQLLARIPFLEVSILDSDLNNIISQILSDINFRDINTYSATNAQALRHILKWFQQNKARNAWLIIPLIDRLSDNQIINISGVTQTIVDTIRSRIDNLRIIKTATEADDELVREVE